jgi:hypothetical protein
MRRSGMTIGLPMAAILATVIVAFGYVYYFLYGGGDCVIVQLSSAVDSGSV